MKAGFTFSHQLNPVLTILRDKTCKYGSVTNLTLLSTFPSVGVGQNKVDAALDGSPEHLTIGVGVLYEGSGALIQVSHKVCEHFDGSLIGWKRRDVRFTLLGRGQTLGTEMKLPPMQFFRKSTRKTSIGAQ
jgi:hypothetical protein